MVNETVSVFGVGFIYNIPILYAYVSQGTNSRNSD
jgi:hypothetical protein